MENLIKARGPVRAALTRTLNKVDLELAKDELDKRDLEFCQRKMIQIEEQLADLDQKILGEMLDDPDFTEETYEAESLAIEEYHDRMTLAKINLEKALTVGRPGSPANSSSGTVTEGGTKRTYRLPKIELKKFNGELTEWLGWWSQFEKIHKDEDLHPSDKFQYLSQSMVPGTRAEKLLQSYPQTGDNYPKVILALKDRYGDKTLLSEVYVRKLLKMVVENVGKYKEVNLPSMFDELESHLRALESLGVSADESAIFLYPLVESSLPEDVIKAWQRCPSSGYEEDKELKSDERLRALMKFLKSEVKGAERLLHVKSGLSGITPKKEVRINHRKFNSEDIPTAAGLHIGQSSCVFCEKSHESDKCIKAQSLSIEDKRSKVQARRACYVCLRIGHPAKKCKAAVRCLLCSKKHLTIMCPDIPSKNESTTESKKEETLTSLANLNCTSQVLLQTLNVVVLNEKGGKKKVRALLDSGSQRSYILQKTACDINLKPIGQLNMQHLLFGGSSETKTHRKYNVRLQSICGRYQDSFQMLDHTTICSSIPRATKGPWLKELKGKGIKLNDIGVGNPDIEILLGSDYYIPLLTGKRYRFKNGLWAMETLYGWMIAGKSQSQVQDESSVAMSVTSGQIKDSSIADLWRLEAIGIRDPVEKLSQEEKEESTKAKFEETVVRAVDGRYTVQLPWVEGVQSIPSNFKIAEKRLASVTSKYLSCPEKFNLYDQIFEDWLDEGIIEEVQEGNGVGCDVVHYLPHRPVFKVQSLTTPLRPVFDASCKTKRSPSLNECLEKGPNLMELIPSVLLRFRENNIGVVADIRKAFQMVTVDSKDRDFLRFLWWKQDKKSLRIFRHVRVVFGLNSSPFLLAAVLNHHLKSEIGNWSDWVIPKLSKSLYVDNVVTSVNTVEEYLEFQEQSIQVMALAKMDLRQWEHSSMEEAEVGLLTSRRCGLATGGDCVPQELSKVLGIKWDKVNDLLSFEIPEAKEKEKHTKRSMLSAVQKIYDPIGILSPVLLVPKMILQDTWDLKLGWDEELPEIFQRRFKDWLQETSCLTALRFLRNFTAGATTRDSWQIHTFSDASQSAYAACVFLRTVNQGVVSVDFLQGKARVAPIGKEKQRKDGTGKQRPTIPRLELLGCTIAARLTKSVKEALSIGDDVPTYFWSDSQTVLSWIKRNDSWGTFVGNRVREICLLSKEKDWRHVPGIYNPADLPSRGCLPQQLLDSKWWQGPEWLKLNQDEWPTEEVRVNEEEVSLERKKSSVTMTVTANSSDSFHSHLPFSSYRKNVRVLCYIRRFIQSCRKIESRNHGPISEEEFVSAEKTLLKMVQTECFSTVELVSGLRVQLMTDGLLHVKTKLLYRKDSEDFKYPILLPKSHAVVDQIIRQHHLENCHAGVQFLMGSLREHYWILQSRRVIRSVISKCVKCRRFTTKKLQTVPSPLPEERIKTGKVFEITGVDLAGPLFVKVGRGKSQKKVWIVLFTCAIYRCVHLELIESLSTEEFIEALSNFISRRGRPSVIHSDNGTNFVGTENAFRKLDWNKILEHSSIERMKWKFNPPSAAWWGGYWERLIGTVKNLLRRMLGNEKLTFRALSNILIKVEAVINGRPLTTVTEDPEDLVPLTPAMFLHEIPTSVTDDLDACGFQKVYEDRKKLIDEFKMRFRKEYLALLVQKGKGSSINFQEGDVVLVGSDNRKRWEWPMAKVLELIPGKDGHVRVVKLKTSGGILTRPVQRIFPLEVSAVKVIPSIKTEDGEKNTSVFTRLGRRIIVPKRYSD